jgi:bifunctional DNA-binding transcriptional regulator/antitoxin component of YhaV-PrlF toxin-antitoxin module
MLSSVTVRGQTAIPATIRKRFNIVAHTKLEWIDDGVTISVIPIPKNPVHSLRGKFRQKGLMTALKRERHEERTDGR